MTVPRGSNGDRKTVVAGLVMALHTAKEEIDQALRNKRKAPIKEAVALYELDRISNTNKPEIRRRRKAEAEARKKMEEIFVISEQDTAFDEYQRLLVEADEHARICLILEAEINAKVTEFSDCKAEIDSADQKVHDARKHRSEIENTLCELIIDMTPTPDKYRRLVKVTINDDGYIKAKIGRDDISGAYIQFHPDGTIINSPEAFTEQIQFLEMLDSHSREDAALAAD